MAKEADWYFDFISPYPYLQLARFSELPDDLVIRPRPVLFAALLNHWGHKGPAEIPAKKRQTYLYTKWLADQRGLPFAGPPRHPFNPLAVLRLCLARGASLEAVRIIYGHIWGEGNDGQDPQSIAALAEKLGIDDPDAATADPSVKAALKENTDAAIARGVYGVPTFDYEGELFWGDDATGLFAAFLADPKIFGGPAYQALDKIEAAAVRKPR